MASVELIIEFPVKDGSGEWIRAVHRQDPGAKTDKPNQSDHGHMRRLAYDVLTKNKNLRCIIQRRDCDGAVTDVEHWDWCSRTCGPLMRECYSLMENCDAADHQALVR